jgi:ComF family protein
MFAIAPGTVNQSVPSKSTMRRLLAAFGSVLAPSQCVLCDRPGLPGLVDLCAGCLAEFPRAGPIDFPRAGTFELTCCPWSFEFPVDELVRALKFRGERGYARLLGTLLARERLARGPPWPDRVIPVPLHRLRWRERGYNQAAELARFAARELGIAFEPRALLRRRATREQTALHFGARAANVRQAFAAAKPLQGLRVALVDDVITTGSTVSEAAAALRIAGARAVELWVIARAVRRYGRG